jgi:hypothetical protein
MYVDLESQIFHTLSDSVFKSIGPGLALSEVYNLIYKIYQKMLNVKGFIGKTKKLELMSLVIYYMQLFDTDILSNDFFHRGGIKFNKCKLSRTKIVDDDYYALIKKVVIKKKEIISNLYKMETDYLSSKLMMQISKSNYLLQIVVVVMTLLSLAIAAISIAK